MLRDLREENTGFATRLEANLACRILERRTVASRLARYLKNRTEETELDRRLEEHRAQALEEDFARTTSFLEPGNLRVEIGRFLEADEEDEAHESSKVTEDDYEALLERDVGGSREKRPLSIEELMKLHSEGVTVLPEALASTMSILQPTSTAAERSFSKARRARRYDQGSLNDDRFASYLFLKDYYEKTKPWLKTAAKDPKTKRAGNAPKK